MHIRAVAVVLTILLAGFAFPCRDVTAQVLLNEANSVSDTEGPGFLSIDLGKPYEGYDYGSIPYSGNTNLPTDSTPGNPFAPDLSSAGGTQTSLVDGFDTVTNPRGFARIQFNGGEWIELTITHDHTDLRGMTFHWVDDFDDDNDYGELMSQDPTLTENERGAVRFSNNKALANLRAGTIITIAENQFINEVRDDYPFGFFNTGLDDTGHDYDLSTDTSFDPFDGNDDWHINFHLDESVTNGASPADTDFFRANSDLEVSNEQWAGKILDATNNVNDVINDPALDYFDLDVTTGEITGLIGENDGLASGFGLVTSGGGVGDDEALALLSNPDSGEVDNGYYEDVDWSSFGTPNLFNMRTDAADADGDGIIEGDIVIGSIEDDSTLSQVQDFSGLRTPVRDNTYEWVATGTEDFSTAANWQRSNDNATAATGAAANWTAVLNHGAGGNAVAQVTSNTTIEFATVMASSGTMTLDVQSGATLNVTGSTRMGFESPGRILTMDGGTVEVGGTIVADVVEAFAGATVTGNGLIDGNLINTAGTIAPGNNSGNVLSVSGDFFQDSTGTLEFTISGNGLGDLTFLDVGGDAIVDGLVNVILDGFTPMSGSTYTLLAANSVTDLGLSITGSQFTLSVTPTTIEVTFTGSSVDADFNNDGALDCADIDELVGIIAGGTDDPNFDLTGDGSVNLADRDEWLGLAGAANLASGNSYLLGDANLDGTVDGLDFIDWNTNKFTSTPEWCSGDFNADGTVDGLDFIDWNGNKFMSADAVAVPEPASMALMAFALLWLRVKR